MESEEKFFHEFSTLKSEERGTLVFDILCSLRDVISLLLEAARTKVELIGIGFSMFLVGLREVYDINH